MHSSTFKTYTTEGVINIQGSQSHGAYQPAIVRLTTSWAMYSPENAMTLTIDGEVWKLMIRKMCIGLDPTTDWDFGPVHETPNGKVAIHRVGNGELRDGPLEFHIYYRLTRLAVLTADEVDAMRQITHLILG